MELDREGFARPVFGDGEPERPADEMRDEFSRTCPGLLVDAPPATDGRDEAVFGPVVSMWRGWASEPETRHRGSSGGVITALSRWALDSGEAAAVVATRQAVDPRRSVPVTLRSGDEAEMAAGSRYAPVSNAAVSAGADGIFVGKPCEVSATRALGSSRGENPGLLIAFFCAGVPSQHATDELIRRVGVPDGDELGSLRYRGDGWPGMFAVVDSAGERHAATYEESWGDVLGKALQWRCKVCPDGLGRQADIAVGDLWATDASGFPTFEDAPGVSVVIARSERGHAALLKARADGALVLEPVSSGLVAAAQPYQVERLTTLGARLAGAVLAGRPVPRYRGFRLTRRVAQAPVRSVRAFLGSFKRSAQWRATAIRRERG